VHPKHLANVREIVIDLGEEVYVFVVAEKRVHVVGMRQDVATPAVQHGQLQEGCEVLGLVRKEQVSGYFLKQPLVAMALAQLVLQMPVLTRADAYQIPSNLSR